MSKVITPREAADLLKDDMTLAFGGFVGFGTPEELLIALRERFLETGSPRGLTFFHGAGVGDGKERGANHLAQEGLGKRIICAHVGLAPKMGKLLMENKLEAFIVPQGVASHILRCIAGGKPGMLTHIGLHTFADPRVEGCRANDAAKNSDFGIVELMPYAGKDYLFYKSFPIDMCFIKGTVADEDGNITLTKEALIADQFEMAAAAHNSGGKVVVQVEQVVKKGTLRVQDIKIHGFMVDHIVVAKPENNCQSFMCDYYRPELTGERIIPMGAIPPMPLNERKVCGRRGALMLKKGALVNLGIGVPEAVSAVAGEEGVSDKITLSIESGVLGGVPTGGLGIGGTINPEAIIKQPDTFDIYDGGGIDLSFLGAAEIDETGNVNVSKFAGRMVGCGGFINISQNAKIVCFTGTFTAGKLKTEIRNGKLNILQDGTGIKFIKKVEQITFSAKYANESGKQIYYLTERALFMLVPEGIKLMEIAPGVDLQRDILDKMEFVPIIPDKVALMDERIFREEKMGLSLD